MVVQAVANKCNIVEYVLTKSGELFYGLFCDKEINKKIISNYIEYLDCDSVQPIPCDPSDCTPPLITFSCSLKVVNLLYNYDGENDLYVFSIDPTMIVGGTPPFTYNWQFEEKDFIISEGGINSPELKLTLKPGKIFSTLVSNIIATVTDVDGCASTKSCWIADGVMKCGVNYVACPNPNGLTVVNFITYCVAPSSLIVSKV